MAKARFVSDNYTLAATLTASSALVDRPVSFLTSTARWKKWRSATSTDDQWVVVDLGAARLVRCVALVDWSAHEGGSIAAQYWDGAAWRAFGAFALPSLNFTRVTALWNVDGVSTSKIRIYWTNTLTLAASVDLGVAIVGTYYQPTYNLVDGFTFDVIDPSLVVAAIDGQEESQTRTQYHIVEGSFEVEPESDLTAFRTMFSAIGVRRPILAATDADDHAETFYGRLTGLKAGQQFGDYWTIPMQLIEAR